MKESRLLRGILSRSVTAKAGISGCVGLPCGPCQSYMGEREEKLNIFYFQEKRGSHVVKLQ